MRLLFGEVASETSGLTGSGGEHVLIVQEVLYPGHHVVDVCRCWKLDTLPILVDPCVIQPDREYTFSAETLYEVNVDETTTY